MMKKLLLALALLLPTFAQAQIISPLPVTLTNGTLADANQVMADFNAIVTGVNTNAAKNGVNSDITALNALSTPITPVQGGSNVYIGAGSGTANAQLVVVPTPSGFTLTSGYTVNFIPGVSNTSSATLSVAGTTAKAVLRQTSAGLQPLGGGEIVVGQMATVIYDGTQYELINNAAGAVVPIGTIIDTASAVGVPAGYLAANGAAVSRTTFSGLFNVISVTGVAATTTSGSASVVVPNSALFQVGWSVGGTNVTCNSTISSIPDGTHISISINAGGNGATTLTIGPYPQGDCSTTFNVPNFQGRMTTMVDTATGTLSATACPNPATIGSRCGSTTQTILTANLPPYTPSGTVTGTVPISASPSVQSGAIPNVVSSGGTTSISATFSGVAQGGTSTPFLLQPVGLVTKAIKF